MNMQQGQVIVKVIGKSEISGGTFKNDDGEAVSWTAKRQPAVLIRGEYREPMNVRLREDQPDYPPGEYMFNLEQMINLKNGAPLLDKFVSLIPLATK